MKHSESEFLGKVARENHYKPPETVVLKVKFYPIYPERDGGSKDPKLKPIGIACDIGEYRAYSATAGIVKRSGHDYNTDNWTPDWCELHARVIKILGEWH